MQITSEEWIKIGPLLEKFLFFQGFITPHEREEFLSWNLKKVPSFHDIIDIKKSAQRIIGAIERKEVIGIYGDYDVDGTTSCALLGWFFRYFGIEVEMIQPGRFIEGYGLHDSSIDLAVEKKINLLITVDCGISNVTQAEYALTKNNFDLIITDHHKDGAPEIPKAFAVINPNRRDENPTSPFKALAGVGVAFALAVVVKDFWDQKYPLQKIPSLYPLLQWVAIGTVCDMAPINQVNRILIRHGLKLMQEQPYPGIKRFFSESEQQMRKIVSSEKLSFLMGPMINSKGRLDHPRAALDLLLGQNHQIDQIEQNYRILESSNQQRKWIQAEVFKEAKVRAEDFFKSFSGLNIKNPPQVLVVYEPHWHEGVIGIVASKLVENFKIPSVVLTKSEETGLLKGSARTYDKIDMFSLLKNCSQYFVKFGGHFAAAGLSMEEKHLKNFIYSINLNKKEMPNKSHDKLDISEKDQVTLDFNDITPNVVKVYDYLEPFGNGFSRPQVKINHLKLLSFSILKDVHVKWEFSTSDILQNSLGKTQVLKGISFNYLNEKTNLHPDEIIKRQKSETLSASVIPGLNHFKGKDYLQLTVCALKFGH
jgi:single-stranded-DNA-specific exonuclease